MSEFYDGRPLRDIEWAAKFALHPAGFNYVWNTYCTPQDAGSAHWSHLCPDTPLELLQTVSHLCEYRKESAACVDWRISKPTYRKHWQTTLWYLAANLNEIHWEARLEGFQPMATSYFSNVEGSLDCTECPIRRPRSEPHQRFAYSGKKKNHTIIYEVGCRLWDGYIVHLPSWLAMWGANVDIQMARRTGVLDKLPAGKKLMMDKGYIGLPPDKIVIPFKGDWHSLTLEQQTHNSAVASVRIEVEHAIRMIKKWDCLNVDWRHSLDLHVAAFHCCGNFANIFMRDHPNRSTVNTWLM